MPGEPVIVVLGAPVQPDGSPSPALRRRAAWAAELYRRAPESGIIASGGLVRGPVTEARVIATLLRAAGVPESRVLLEERSRNTWQNARCCAPILRARGATRPVLVTDPLHLPRARLAFRAFGLRVTACPLCRETGPGAAAWRPRDLLHEALGLPLYAGRLVLARLRDAIGR